MNNNVNIPEDKLNQSILKGIEKGRCEKIMRKRKNNINIKRIASIFVIGSLGIGITFPIVAQAFINIEGAIKVFIESALPEPYSKELKDEKNSKKMVVKNDNGIATLESSTLDNNIFIANITLESEFLKQYEENDLKHSLHNELYISIGSKDNIVGGGGVIKKIDDNKASILVISDIGDANIDKSVDIYINFKEIFIASNEWENNDRQKLQGNWNFSYSLDKVESIKNIYVNDKIQIDEKNMTLESIEITPLATYIKITADENIKDIDAYYYKVVDDKGKIYKFDKLDGCTDENGTWNFKYAIYDDLSKVKSLSITPYYEDKFISNKIHNQDLYKMVTTMEANSQIEEITVSRDVEKRDLDVDTKPADKYGGTKISYQLDIDKERKFYTIDELIGKEIQTGNQTTVAIKDIKVNDKNTEVVIKTNGDYGKLGQIVLFDENMRDAYSGIYVTHKGKYPINTHMENVKDDYYESGEFKFIIEKIDLNKKYKIAVPIQKEIKLNPKHTMSVDL